MKAAERFFAEVIAEYGITEGDVVRIPMTQCELARRRRKAASTVGAYLSAMGPRVVRRSPEIILATDTSAGRPVLVEHDEAALLAAYRDLALAQARVIELQAGFADPARGSRAAGRGSREMSREAEEDKQEDTPSSLLELGGPRADVADPAGWTDRDLDAVLAPLVRAVERAGLQRMNNRTKLTQVLRPYPLARIEAAVGELVRQVNQRDSSLRSPFGLLHQWALNGDLPTPPTAVTPVAPAPAAPPAEAVIAGVRDAVASLTAGELADLDRLVDAEYGSKVPMPPAMRHAARLEQYPAWVSSGAPRAHHEDTTGTPRGDRQDTPSTPGAHR